MLPSAGGGRCGSANSARLGISEHFFGKHGVRVNDNTRVIRGPDAGVQKGNEVFRNVTVLTSIVPVITILFVPRQEIVDG
jgi:hypothetical protein